MAHSLRITSRRALWTSAALCLFAFVPTIVPDAFSTEEQATAPIQPRIQAFQPGETLKYDVSWSNIVTAGTAVMEVKEERLSDGKEVLMFVLSGRSAGLVDQFIRVNDTVTSVFDPLDMQSISYKLNENYGKKKRSRELIFDRERKRVVSRLNDDPPETFDIPDQEQDALSSLYYLRTKEDFTVGKAMVIFVHDGGKNWSVEVQILGREKVKTPAGEFATIKVRTYPRHEGVFMNKGVVFIWLTDDSRKVPVLMKSTLKVGSFVFTLTDMKPGDELQ
jgi:uncharacterized protein DUF3108